MASHQSHALLFSLLLCFSQFAQAEKCNSPTDENFLTFFHHFTSDKSFAIGRTLYPLKVRAQQYGIDQLGNDLSSAIRLYRTEQEDKAIPTLAVTMQQGNLLAKVHETSATTSVVQLFADNPEWGQTYHFSLRGKCWFLREFREHTVSPEHWVKHQESAPRSASTPHFYIKHDNLQLRAMLHVLNHLSFVLESLTSRDTDDAQAELLSLTENLDHNTEYSIKNRQEIVERLHKVLALFDQGEDANAAALLGDISRNLWLEID